MLAEADTIQKAKELKTLALTAGEWARRKNMGEEAISHCRSYALEAERKMGEMLVSTERAKGVRVNGKEKGNIGGTVVLPPKKEPTLSELGLTKRESSEAQKLARLPVEIFEAVKNGKRTRNNVHVANNSGENEWYTPPEYIEAARTAMGGIDCDPASSRQANKTVKAEVFFDVRDDGLSRKWSGNVWLNPPYARPLIELFTESLVSKFGSGEVKQACVLVNNATETAWFQAMLVVCRAVCFPKGRVRFIDKEGNPGAPLQGQAVIYIGTRVAGFRRAFTGFGPVLLRE